MKINHRLLSRILYFVAILLGIYRILISLYELYPVTIVTLRGLWPGYIARYSSLFPETLATPISVILYLLRSSINSLVFIVCSILLIFYRKNIHWRKFIIWGCIILCLEICAYFDIRYHEALASITFPIKTLTFPALMLSYGFYKKHLYRIHGME